MRIIFENIIDTVKLPFRKDRQLCRSFYRILGFYPRRVWLYKQATMHRSMNFKNKGGGRVNNERLEFLGDAVLGAVVGDIVFREFDGRAEGFLTNTRSKIVKRETLGRLAHGMGLSDLIRSNAGSRSHNSYTEGNALEALIGAVYLDRGYFHCMWFVRERILNKYLDLAKISSEEVNFKSRLLEWGQKNHLQVEFELVEQIMDEHTKSPKFLHRVLLGGVECASAWGFSKKESHQSASRIALEKMRSDTKLRHKVLGNTI